MRTWLPVVALHLLALTLVSGTDVGTQLEATGADDDTPETALERERDTLLRSWGSAESGETAVLRPHAASERETRGAAALRSLASFPRFNVSSPAVRRYAYLVERHLSPWRRIQGMTTGMGSGGGMVSQTILDSMSTMVRGEIYFRYGGFLRDWYATRRFVLTLKTIQRAIQEYSLESLSAEFFLNNFDQPMSLDSSPADSRGGYPIFSTQTWPNAVDIPYPDPLDLEESYMATGAHKVPWDKRRSQAVFRGGSTSYLLYNTTNWRANPRFRLHRMSEARPDLLDARIVAWSKLVGSDTLQKLEEDDLRVGKRLSRADMDQYKYEVVVDGGGGSSRTCGVLSSGRVMIKQESMYSQFFQALLKPFVHYVPTEHHFEDLYEHIEWLQKHDNAASAILKRAHAAAHRACTWEGRALYWAILLVKYSKEAMERSSYVEAPELVCTHILPERSIRKWKTVEDRLAQVPEGWPFKCEEFDQKPQPACTTFCTWGFLSNFPKQWVSMKSLEHIHMDGL